MKQLKLKSLFGVPAMMLCSIVGCLNAGWWRTYGGSDKDQGMCVQQTSDGGYIVTGVTYSFGRPGESDIWLIKLDSLGHTEWTREYEAGWGFSVRETDEYEYIIAGSRIIKTDVNGDTIWTRDFGATAYCVQITDDGNYVVTGKKSDNLWLIKIDDMGDSLWSKTYSIGSYADYGEYIEQTSDGGYIIVGETGTVDQENELFKSSLWLLKTDANGDTVWTKTYGGDEWDQWDRGNCVRQTKEGEYIITGYKDNSFWLLKTDTLGDTLWTRIFGGGEGFCVQETSDSNYILTGEGPAANVQTSSLPVGGDLWLAKVDPNGDTIWTRSYGGEDTDVGRYVQQTSDRGYIVTGYTWSYGAGHEDIYLLKTDSLGLLAVKEQPIPEVRRNWELVASVGAQIILRYFNTPQGFHASVFDVSGRKIDELHSLNNSGIVTWGIGFTSGVYFIKANNLNQAATVKVVIIN